MTLASSRPTGEALLGLLSPFWEVVIGGCALVVFVVSIRRLARRGPSRMTTAMLVTGVAVIAIAALDYLLQAH
jgi:hypothetical protein